jgi:hypothetical protein
MGDGGWMIVDGGSAEGARREVRGNAEGRRQNAEKG